MDRGTHICMDGERIVSLTVRRRLGWNGIVSEGCAERRGLGQLADAK